MSDGITKLSLTGGSGMPIEVLFDCPRKFKLIVDGYRMIKKPMYFAEGTIFHQYAEKIIKGERKDPYSEEEIEGVKEDLKNGKVWDDKKEQYIQVDAEKKAYNRDNCKTKEIDNVGKRLFKMLGQVHDQLPRFEGVSHIERPVETIMLINPTSEKISDAQQRLCDEGIVFCGTIDIDRKDRVEDLKTAAPSRLAKLTEEEQEIIDGGGWLKSNGHFDAENSTQLHLYAYLKTIADESMVDEVAFHVFSKHVTKSVYYPIKAKIGIKQYMVTYELAMDAGDLYLHCSKKKKWPQWGYKSGCKDMFFQTCPYHSVCFPERYSDEEKAQSNIERRE